jgi:hypothetical protein
VHSLTSFLECTTVLGHDVKLATPLFCGRPDPEPKVKFKNYFKNHPKNPLKIVLTNVGGSCDNSLIKSNTNER